MLFKREEENNWRCFFPLCKSNFLNFSKEKTSIELKTPNTFKWFYFSFAYKSSLFFNTSTYLHSSYNLNFYYDFFFFAIKLSETAILMNSSPGPSSVRNVVWDDSFHFSCFQALMYDVFGMMKYDYVTISMVISRVLNVFWSITTVLKIYWCKKNVGSILIILTCHRQRISTWKHFICNDPSRHI